MLFNHNRLFFKGFLFTLLLVFGISFQSYSQKKGGGKGTKDIIVRSCTQYIGNGLYRVNFGYDNPNKKETSINEDNSYVVSNKGKNKTKGLNKFKSGSVDKAFSREFNANESVEWTVINPSGKVHTVIANANSSHCSEVESVNIVPLFGQGTGTSFDNVLDVALLALAKGNAGDNPSDIVFRINENQEVAIEIVPQAGKMTELIDLLINNFGLQYIANSNLSNFLIDPNKTIAKGLSSIDVFTPINTLFEYENYNTIINFARPLYHSFKGSGIVTSQGDSSQYSDIVKESFKTVIDGEIVSVDGAGIKIGIISDSWNQQPYTNISKWEIDVLNGDLPGLGNPDGHVTPVQLLKDGENGDSDEGRAMGQIIHDVAPGASIAFHTGSSSPREFELAIEELEAVGSNIIIDDITFMTEPFFKKGNNTQAIEQFTDISGNIHVTSAGNFGKYGYQSIFNSSTNTPNTNFIPSGSLAKAHVFGLNSDGTEDVLQKFQAEVGIYTIVLQWFEDLASQENNLGAITDLDINIVDNLGNLLVGNNRISLNGDSTEILFFQALANQEANILITSANGSPSTNLPFRYIVFRSNGFNLLEYNQGAPTISGHAMYSNAIGAVNQSKAQNPESEIFSSFGGMTTHQYNIPVALSAPDGVHTNVSSIGQIIGNDTFPSFFGTSAAAPHAAAAIALLMSAVPSWYPYGLPGSSPTITNPMADKTMQIFKQNATSFGDIDQGGSGLINVEKTFKSLANQTPILLSWTGEDGKTPGIDPIEVTLIGKYFLSEDKTKVIFDGKELDIISITETEIVVQVSPFTSNPCFLVSSNSKTPGGTDGGDSNCLHLLEDGKLAINIIADDLSYTFGQSVQMTYTVEGLPDGETLESSGLTELQFSSPAVFPYPDVNNYVVTPHYDEALTDEQLASFQINFVNGLLSITETDLTVQPEDASVIYGEPIVLNSNFIYITDGIENNNDFLTILNSDYQSTFYPDNTLILVNKFRAVVNEYDFLNILNEGAWMISDMVIQNKFRAVVNGMNFVDLDMDHLIDYQIAVEDATTNKFRAVVNKFRAVVNGTDLLSNNVEISIENKFRAVVNSSGLGDENDLNSYDHTFTLIDADDASDDTQENAISELFSTYLITGKDATLNQEGRHIIYPGALLHPIFANFNKIFAPAKLTILAKELEYTTNDIIVNQGEYPDSDAIIITFNGFAYDENIETVSPDGRIPLYFVNENGDEFEVGDAGVFYIKIREPQIENRVPLSNYSLINNNPGRLFVNPYGNHLRKIRTYLDCVEEITNSTGGLNYIAHFRYENPNSETIFVLHGSENSITGTAELDDTNLPYVFLPGQGTFEIPFDAGNGNKITWNLTTFDSTHKTSVSSDATADSGKCDAKQTDNTSYSVFPNPVTNTLTIQQNVSESSTIDIYDMYGILHFHDNFYNNGSDSIEVDVSSFSNGIYYVRITSNKDVSVFNIMKE